MNSHTALLGLFTPGTGWLYRLGVGWKYLLVLLVSAPPILAGRGWVTGAALVLVIALLASSGVGPRRSLSLGWMLAAVLLGIAVVHLLMGRAEVAVVQSGNILVAVLAARMLTLTTSTPVLVDALVVGLRPLRSLGLDTQRLALAVALMIRSLPFLLGSVGDARDAARARGLTRHPLRLLTPVVVGAVAYADRTGEALQARGLGEARDSTGGGFHH